MGLEGVAGAGEGEGPDGSGAVVAEDAGAGADGGAGGDDVVEEADGGALERWAAAGEGVGEGAIAGGGGAADLAAGVAHATEFDGRLRELEGTQEEGGLVEATLSFAGGVERDGHPGHDGYGLDERAQFGGHERDKGTIPFVLQAVDERPGGAFVLVGGADAGEVAEVEAAGAEAIVSPGGAAIGAAARAPGGDETGPAAVAECGIEGGAAGAAERKQEVEEVPAEGSVPHGGRG